jgi:aminopeptidase N
MNCIYSSCRKFKTFNEDELWEALTSQAKEDMTLEESISVQEIAKSWVTKDRFPVVTVARDYQDKSASVEQVHAAVGHSRLREARNSYKIRQILK